jgi:hypothetical protein
MFDAIGTLHILGVVIGAAFSGWIVTMQVQRRMKKPLGRNATDLELASLKTWMRVEEAEQREEESSPIHPH